ncbi:ankyrin repeat domain-containing protein, partial [Bacteroidota bacterium]
GEAYLKNGNIQLSITNYKKALEIDPDYPSAIQALINIEKQNSEKSNFFRAAQKGNNDSIKALLKRNPDLINAISFMGTALHMSAFSGHPETAELLIKSGAGLNVQDRRGWTALHYAAMLEHTDIINLLIKNDADLNITNKSGKTPLHITIGALNSKKQVPVITSILINKGARINTVATNGNTPLLDAIESGYSDIVNLMIKSGAKIEDLIKSNSELIFTASIRGYSEIVKILINHGAEYNLKDSLGKTPLYYASKHGNKQVADVLIKTGANEQIIENNYQTGEYLNKNIRNNQAYIWCLNHRGWAVKTKEHFLVFDDELAGVAPDCPSLANGSISANEIKNEDVISFFTCWHGEADQGSHIHNIEDSINNISHILNEIDVYRGSNKCTYMSPGKKTVVQDVEITSIFSEQMTLSYIIETDGLKIFYSGFVNEKEVVEKELDSLKAKIENFDIAFISVTGMDSDPESYYEWSDAIINRLNPKMIIPTGMSYYTEQFIKYKNHINNKYPGIIVKFASNPGDRISYN